MNRRRAAARTLTALAVLAAHLLLLLQGPRAPAPRSAGVAAPRVTVRLLAMPKPTPTPVAAPAPITPAPRGPTRVAAPRRPPAPIVATETRTDERAAALAITPLPPAAAASAADNDTSLLDSAATRRAIRAAARAPLLDERAAAATGAPARATAEQRLGSEVQRAARGDCLKGEFLGGGMGLLSLPFLAAAALRDQCRR